MFYFRVWMTNNEVLGNLKWCTHVVCINRFLQKCRNMKNKQKTCLHRKSENMYSSLWAWLLSLSLLQLVLLPALYNTSLPSMLCSFGTEFVIMVPEHHIVSTACNLQVLRKAEPDYWVHANSFRFSWHLLAASHISIVLQLCPHIESITQLMAKLAPGWIIETKPEMTKTFILSFKGS